MPERKPKTVIEPPSAPKKSDTVLFQLRCSPALHRFYTDWARREHRSAHSQIMEVLEAAATEEIERRERGVGVKYLPPQLRDRPREG